MSEGAYFVAADENERLRRIAEHCQNTMAKAERERDEARAEVTFKDKVIWAARADVNEAVALLRECRRSLWAEKLAHDLACHASDGSREDLLARLDAFLAGGGE